MDNLNHQHPPNNPLFRLKCFRKMEALENRYIHCLSKISPSFEASFRTFLDLQKIQNERKQLIRFLELKPSSPDYETVAPLLGRYLSQIDRFHQKVDFWFKLYLGFIWPDEIIDPKLKKRLGRKIKKEDWQTNAKGSLENLRPDDFLNDDRRDSLSRLQDLTRSITGGERNTRLWSRNHRALMDAIYDELNYTGNEVRERTVHLFEKTLYTHGCTDSRRESSIHDWLNGYKIAGDLERHDQDNAVRRFLKGLRTSDRTRTFRLAARNISLALLATLIYCGIHAVNIDTVVFQTVKDGALRILSLDPASLRLKSKQNYFYKYIVELDKNVKTDDVLAQVGTFKDQRLFEQPSGVYFFAEKILQKYFLLLTKESISDEMVGQVLECAGLIDPFMKKVLGEITEMFQNKFIEDSKLRGKLLELRRAFVRHNIFPFTFIVIEDDTPYLFLYPEYILQRVKFQAAELDKIGFRSAYYAQFVRFPLRAYVVKGDRYPFKDRAGYFEGEYAIVFADLAAQTEWSAWHEIAHIIDYMRLMYGAKALPRNIEINATLFPSIYAQSPKEYLLRRMFPFLESRVSGDAYVQAAKGIANGFLLVDAEQRNGEAQLITNQMPGEAIAAAKALLSAKSDEWIRASALEIYKNPGKYLATAKAGQYRGIISNAEEVVAGTPNAPYQGFILGGYAKSLTAKNSGIKFSFDNQDSNLGFFQGKNIFGIIQEIFFFMLHAHSSDIKGFTLMNIIAAVVDFILILGIFFGVHRWSTPYRKSKFYGPDFAKLITRIYRKNPLSDGRGSGEQPGEKKLLARTIASKGEIGDDLRQSVKALKSEMNPSQMALFDTLLTLAPFNPKISAVVSKWHDFLFWFPWIGPSLARNSWLSPRQKAFGQWEQFNSRLFDLAARIRPDMSQEQFRRSYLKILNDFKKPAKAIELQSQKDFIHLKETEDLAKNILHGSTRASDHKTPVPARSLPWLGQQDGEFDHLASYTWSDDVKRIDWKATARSSNKEAKVRKYTGQTSAHFDFLMDFRSFNRQDKRDKLARDLVHSLGILKNDNELRSLTLIMPSGEIRHERLNLKSTPNRLAMCGNIFLTIHRMFEEDLSEQRAFKAEDLLFYTDEENKLYSRITQLTEFDHQNDSPKDITAIPAESLNVYLIGVDENQRTPIIDHLPKAHQPFYWE